MSNERSDGLTALQALALVPALVAMVVAGLYVAGAAQLATRYHHAGLNVIDVLPMLPPQALLAAGIPSGLNALIDAALILGVIAWLWFRYGRSGAAAAELVVPPAHEPRRVGMTVAARLSRAAIILVVGAIFAPWAAWLVLAAVILTLVAVDDAHRAWRASARRRAYVAGAVGALVLFLIEPALDQVFDPRDLSRVTVTTTAKEPRTHKPIMVAGKLVAVIGPAVYVTTSRYRLAIIPLTRIAKLDVVSATSYLPRPVLNRLIGWPPRQKSDVVCPADVCGHRTVIRR